MNHKIPILIVLAIANSAFAVVNIKQIEWVGWFNFSATLTCLASAFLIWTSGIE